MSIKRFIIRDLEPQHNAEYIANYFWNKKIAKVSSITILPYIIDGKILGIAYITIDSFCDSKATDNFIYHMEGVVGYIISHTDEEEDNFWVLEPNTHNQGELCVGEFTTNFMPEFFETYEDANNHICGEDELQYNYPIKDLKNNRYTVDEALSYLWILNLQWEQEKKRQIAEEIYEIDSAIKFHLMTECNEIHPTTIDYSEDLINIFSELREAEWMNFLSCQTSIPVRQSDFDFHAQKILYPSSPPGLQRREVATNLNELHILLHCT